MTAGLWTVVYRAAEVKAWTCCVERKRLNDVDKAQTASGPEMIRSDYRRVFAVPPPTHQAANLVFSLGPFGTSDPAPLISPSSLCSHSPPTSHAGPYPPWRSRPVRHLDCCSSLPLAYTLMCSSSADTRRIFHAVFQNQLPIITRRLSTEERLQIRPGDVYVWEERTQHSVDQAGLAIERWTDCFGWGPSRVREVCLHISGYTFRIC